MLLTVCIWPVKKSWCELGGAEADTRRMVQTCGFVFNLGIHICHPSSLSLIYIFEAQAPLHLHYTYILSLLSDALIQRDL